MCFLRLPADVQEYSQGGPKIQQNTPLRVNFHICRKRLVQKTYLSLDWMIIIDYQLYIKMTYQGTIMIITPRVEVDDVVTPSPESVAM